MRIVKSSKTVEATTNLEPAQRTAADGKTWWVVFDNATRKYLDTITFFGKYKTKKECQYAIDQAIEKYGDSLQRTLDNHRKYFSDVKSSKKVCSSTEKPLTKDEVKDLWDKKSLFIDFGDSDAMCQDNGYTLEQVLEYMDQGYEVYVDACTDVNASTVCGASEEVLAKLFKEAKEIVDYFQYHNKNLRKRQDELLMDLSDAVDNGSTVGVRDAIENLKYNTKGMTKDQEYYIMDMYDKFCLADGEYQSLGRPTDYYEEPVMESKKLSANDQALQHIKAAIDILGKSGNKDEVTKDTIANLGVVMFDLKSQK